MGILVLLSLKHPVFWIRLSLQRVLGALFAMSLATGEIASIEKEYLFKLIGMFGYRQLCLSDELPNQLVKNLTFMLKSQLSEVNIAKLFGKLSIVGRKLMLNVTVAAPILAFILLFIQVSLHLFSKEHSVDDNT